ncbi:MAG: hypothetical protein AB7E36_08415 [Salinivirgaceae bacterium]
MNELSLKLIKEKVKNTKLDKFIFGGIISSLVIVGGIIIFLLPHKIDPGFNGFHYWKGIKMYFWGGLIVLPIFLIFRKMNRKEIKGNINLMENTINSDWFKNQKEYPIGNIKEIEYVYFDMGEKASEPKENHWIKIKVENGLEIINEQFLMEENHNEFLDFLKLYHSKGIKISIDSSNDYFQNGIEIKNKIDWLKDGGFSNLTF